jgi:hypothetical protein
MPSEPSRKLFVSRNGKIVELTASAPGQVSAPYVQQDTMDPLRHPISGKVYDSKSQFNAETRASGCVCVGNELLSKKPQNRKEVITEKMVLDRIERAESIINDPSKYRARVEDNYRRLERREKLLNGN